MSLCEKYKKCLICCKHYLVNPKKTHKCYHDTCRHCKALVNIYDHRCYIQRVGKELPEDEITEESSAENDEDEKKKKKPPPLMVFRDIECLIEQDNEGRNLLVADLIRYASEDDPENVSHAWW